MDQNSSERHLNSKEELQQRLAETRHSISETVGEIRQEFTTATEWETYVRRYPLACLCAGGAVGLVLGRKLRSLRDDDETDSRSVSSGDRSAYRYASRYASSYNDASESGPYRNEPSEPSRIAKMAENLATMVFSEVFGLFATKFKQFVSGSSNPVREYGTRDVPRG